ncbi:hypothetical protein B0H63DRAFT_53900 [Podospora didyma]|uniref:Transmembrane protein n=1 Tax=Podospora didyma TaxID=330526 RepID=A0AAE0P7G0_9PEZI|nr:hypothetical protein B0H63DRAFT_53900 [Podospora didyma]
MEYFWRRERLEGGPRRREIDTFSYTLPLPITYKALCICIISSMAFRVVSSKDKIYLLSWAYCLGFSFFRIFIFILLFVLLSLLFPVHPMPCHERREREARLLGTMVGSSFSIVGGEGRGCLLLVWAWFWLIGQKANSGWIISLRGGKKNGKNYLSEEKH